MTAGGAASADDVFGLLEARAKAHPAHVASRTRRGGSWVWTSWGDLHEGANAVRIALADRGVAKGDRVALIAETREEWTVADFGILGAGAVTVPIYPTATRERLASILAHSGARFVVAEGRAQLDALEGAILSAPDVREIVVLDEGAAGTPLRRRDGSEVPVVAYAELVKSGRARLDAPSDRATHAPPRSAAGPDDLATVVYTSGTTGTPRGVMLTHAALLSETRGLLEAFDVGPDDEQLLILPLAHILARVLVLLHVASGSRLAYASGPHRLTRDLAETEPTFFATVPRFLEKLYDVANESARTEGPLRSALWAWALDVGKERADRKRQGARSGGLSSARARYADKLVLSRVRKTFGKRLRFVVSGGAPLPVELGEWLSACGVTVLEGYGLTEIGGASHVNRERAAKLGTVGTPLSGVKVKIAPDGEILLAGPSLMQGYFRDREATLGAVDLDGYLHTGDIGKIDDDGYLTIVDRKKDVIVTAGGSNVAPQNIENLLTGSPWLSHAVVVGDRRPCLVALLTLDEVACRRWASDKKRPDDPSSLARDPELYALIQLDVDAVNRRLTSFETIKRFAVLPRDFSTEAGELTSLGKIRRQVIRERYAGVIDGLYE